MHIQPSRLGWAGNTDWTMRQRRGAFYIYQQHDDLISPTYIADLVDAAARWPKAVLFFSKLRFTGRRGWEISVPSLLGDPIARGLNYLRRLDWVPFRGLIRGSALDQTSGLLLSDLDPFESPGTEQRFLAELSLIGEFRHVEGPTYFKSWHGDNISAKRQDWPRERRVLAQACFAAWQIEVIAPMGDTLEERRRLFYTALDRFAGGAFKQMGSALRRQPKANIALRIWDQLKRNKKLTAAVQGVMPVPFGTRERSVLLAQVFEQLKRDRRFDPSACLGTSWEGLEAKIFGHYRIRPQKPTARIGTP